MFGTKTTGFTLIELLIAVAIAAIILGSGVPSLATIIKDQRLSSVLADVARAAYIARSESAKSGNAVTVCARATDSQCGTDWNNGLLVFRDSSYTSSEAQAYRDPDDEILRVTEPFSSSLNLAATGSTDGTVSGAFTATYLRYRLDGSSSWNSGTFYVCDGRGNVHAQAIQITISGGVQPARTFQGDANTPVQDIFGRDIPCT